MDRIVKRIVDLTRRAAELKRKYGSDFWSGHDDIRHLWIRLRGKLDGHLEALQMMGLDFVADSWDKEGVVLSGHIESLLSKRLSSFVDA